MTYPWLTLPTTDDRREQMIEVERQWELDGIQRGIDRARQEIAEADHKAVAKGSGGLADLDVGAIIMRDIIRPLVPAIKELQQQALEGLHGKAGARAKWWLPLLSLEAEKWAVIVVRTILSGMSPELKDHRPATALSISVANNGKLQREFDLWKKAEAERKRDRGSDYVDLYKLMVSRVKNVDARTARKWMKLTVAADKLDWDKDVRVHVGLRLIELLVTKGGGWFEMIMIGRGSARSRQTERHIKLTDVAKQWIHKRHAITEMQRPYLAPMLSPPDPWRWEEPGSAGRADTQVPAEGREGQDEVQQETEDTQ